MTSHSTDIYPTDTYISCTRKCVRVCQSVLPRIDGKINNTRHNLYQPLYALNKKENHIYLDSIYHAISGHASSPVLQPKRKRKFDRQCLTPQRKYHRHARMCVNNRLMQTLHFALFTPLLKMIIFIIKSLLPLHIN